MNNDFKVLVVEDNHSLRKLIGLTLRPPQFSVTEADNSDAALRIALGLRPDLVLLDVMLPGSMDGYTLCRRVREDTSLAHTRVVILSARGQQADLAAGEAAGADHYMVKPFSPIQLLQLARQYAEQRHDQ